MSLQLLKKTVKYVIVKIIFYIVDIITIFNFLIILWTALVGPFRYEHIGFYGTTLSTDSLYRPVIIIFALICIRWLLCRRFVNYVKLGPFDRPECYLILLLFIYLGIVLPVLFFKYYSFSLVFPHDIGVLNQVFYNTLHGEPFKTTIFTFFKFKKFNFLGGHFSPIIYILLPFYYFHQDSSTLIVIQSLAITLAAIPIYLIANKIIKNKWIALFTSILYLIYPITIKLHFFAFRPTTIAIPLLLLSFYYIEKGKIWASIVLLLLASLCEEIVLLAVFGIGVYLLFKRKIKGHLKFGFTVIFLSMCSLYFIVFKLIPHFSDCGFIPFNQFGRGDYGSLGAAFTNILRRLMTYSHLETNIYIVGIVKALGFIPLLSPIILMSLPFFLQIYMSGIGEEFWHASLIIPFLFVSLIYGFNNLSKISKKRLVIPSIFILVISGLTYGVKSFNKEIIQPFCENKLWESIEPENYGFFKEAKKCILEDGGLLTNTVLLPNLSARKEVHPLFNLERKEPIEIEWILYYKDFSQELAHEPFLKEKYDLLIYQNNFIDIYNEGGFHVMGRIRNKNQSMIINYSTPENINLWKFSPSNTTYSYEFGKKSLTINTYFDGDGQEDEFIQMRYDGFNIDLKKYPFLNLDYAVQDADIQTIEIVVGIDINNDGKDERIVRDIITREKEGIFTISILANTKSKYDDYLYYNLVFVELYLHKKWYVDCSKKPKKGNYEFRLNSLWLSD